MPFTEPRPYLPFEYSGRKAILRQRTGVIVGIGYHETKGGSKRVWYVNFSDNDRSPEPVDPKKLTFEEE